MWRLICTPRGYHSFLRSFTPWFNLQKLAALLYQAADDGGYIDPVKVHKILGYTKEEASRPGLPALPDDVLQD